MCGIGGVEIWGLGFNAYSSCPRELVLQYLTAVLTK